MSLLLLVACNYEFGITETPKPSLGGDDTAEEAQDTAVDTDTTPPPPEDTGATGSGEETAPPPEDTAVVEEPPAEEDPPPEDDCDHTSDLVYALARDDGSLYTFDPASRTFASLGRVSCGTSQTPGSMAVSRDGVAYVRYADEQVYAVDLATMSCSRTSYSDRRTGFGSFGMGYATDSADTWRDQLYVANGSSVGVMDTASWTITTLGAMPSQSELTGNADGELWAMLPLERPAQLVRVDTATGRTAETLSLPSFPNPSNIDTFAFATWNGSFYLFVRESGMGNSTDVYEVTASGSMSKILSDVGFDVVGAGVSTCAPS